MKRKTRPLRDDNAWLRKVRAFSVHLLTASGAAVGLFALIAAADWRWAEMFSWLALALAIDGLDGFLARKFKVAETLPRWSGEALDLVVDFSNYVLTPAFALVAGSLLPPSVELLAAAAIVVSGAIYFADRKMKTKDSYFLGFPAVWNVAAFYFFILRPDPWIVAMSVAVLVVLTFVPVVFVHPLRVERFRSLNIALASVWAVLAGYTLFHELSGPTWVIAGLVAIAMYFLVAGVARPKERKRAK